jgi:Histone-like transcription factor (CBF/NF-Y) and archaeal histone
VPTCRKLRPWGGRTAHFYAIFCSWYILTASYCFGSRASDKCQREKRKTINGDDLLWAMSTLGFEDYVEPLKLYLHKYREVSFVANSASGGAVLHRCGLFFLTSRFMLSCPVASASVSLELNRHLNSCPVGLHESRKPLNLNCGCPKKYFC